MILAIAEHMRNELRKGTFCVLSKGRVLAEAMDSELWLALLGKDLDSMIDALKGVAHKIVAIEDDRLEHFGSETYQWALQHIIMDHKPSMTLIAHTSLGIELAPGLSAATGLPLITNCIELEVVDGRPVGTRQLYNGKVNCQVVFKGQQVMATLRPGALGKDLEAGLKTDVLTYPYPADMPERAKKFKGYAKKPGGEVDITQARTVVCAGRGVKKKDDLALVEDLAAALGGVVACSRPITDKGWLPHDRQVGTSGKTVASNLYIALGVSGAYQHLDGMSACDTIVSINEDPNAPILTVADYAIVDDLYKIVPVLAEKIKAGKT